MSDSNYGVWNADSPNGIPLADTEHSNFQFLGVRSAFRFGERVDSAPSAMIVDDSDNLDYRFLIEESQHLVLMMNHGYTWTSIHREELRRRFEDPSKKTVFFLIDPDSRHLDTLALKGATTVESLRDKSLGTVRIILEIVGESGIEMLGHGLYNPHSMILTETVAVTIPYYTGRGVRTVPASIFSSGHPFYRELGRDAEILRVDSIPLLLKTSGTKPRFVHSLCQK